MCTATGTAMTGKNSSKNQNFFSIPISKVQYSKFTSLLSDDKTSDMIVKHELDGFDWNIESIESAKNKLADFKKSQEERLVIQKDKLNKNPNSKIRKIGETVIVKFSVSDKYRANIEAFCQHHGLASDEFFECIFYKIVKAKKRVVTAHVILSRYKEFRKIASIRELSVSELLRHETLSIDWHNVDSKKIKEVSSSGETAFAAFNLDTTVLDNIKSSIPDVKITTKEIINYLIYNTVTNNKADLSSIPDLPFISVEDRKTMKKEREETGEILERKKKPRIYFHFNAAYQKKLNEYAKENNTSLSEIIRIYIPIFANEFTQENFDGYREKLKSRKLALEHAGINIPKSHIDIIEKISSDSGYSKKSKKNGYSCSEVIRCILAFAAEKLEIFIPEDIPED